MSDKIKTVSVFGATGSVGSSVLDLLSRHSSHFRPHILVAGRNVEKLAELAIKFKPAHVGLADENGYEFLKEKLSGSTITIHIGAQAIADLAAIQTDLTISAITGIAGLLPTLNAVKSGHIVAIANKESLVTAGHIIMESAKESGATILPIDSEHNAIYQAWASGKAKDIHSITLTASGGPFLNHPLDALAAVTPEEALKHPNWSMGEKVSIDSATMMNKGLEVIEASILFDLPEERIKTVIHPSSVIHGMVHYRDGTTLAQLGAADMRIPISYALAWPERLDWGAEPLDLTKLSSLEFRPPEPARFPCLTLAREACQHGAPATTILNAANEIAVESFLAGKIGFLDIASVNAYMLEHIDHSQLNDIDAILLKDAEVRLKSTEWCENRG